MTETLTDVNTVRSNYALAKISLFLAVALFSASNFYYAMNLPAFDGLSTSLEYATFSLLIFGSASFFLGQSAVSYLLIEQKTPSTSWRIGRIISGGVFEQRKLFAAAAVIYAFVFSLLDGILIYQPSVNFGLAYAAYGFTWRVLPCCGLPGDIPVGQLYFPAQHVGVNLIPVSVLLMVLISVLVGLNVSLLYRAYSLSRSSGSRSRTGVAGSVAGAAFGLFSGCPTCAAAFFLSMIAGTGATAFSTIVSAYQPLIVALTIPLLLFSIYWQARSIRTILQGCVVAK